MIIGRLHRIDVEVEDVFEYRPGWKWASVRALTGEPFSWSGFHGCGSTAHTTAPLCHLHDVVVIPDECTCFLPEQSCSVCVNQLENAEIPY